MNIRNAVIKLVSQRQSNSTCFTFTRLLSQHASCRKTTFVSFLESVSLYCSRPGWQPESDCLQRIMGNALLINYNGNLVMFNSGLGIAFPSVRCYPFKEKNICKVISLKVSTYSKWTIFVLPQMVLCWITQLTRFHKSFSKFSLIAIQYSFVSINPGK